jgi:hypothetical protein
MVSRSERTFRHLVKYLWLSRAMTLQESPKGTYFNHWGSLICMWDLLGFLVTLTLRPYGTLQFASKSLVSRDDTPTDVPLSQKYRANCYHEKCTSSDKHIVQVMFSVFHIFSQVVLQKSFVVDICMAFSECLDSLTRIYRSQQPRESETPRFSRRSKECLPADRTNLDAGHDLKSRSLLWCWPWSKIKVTSLMLALSLSMIMMFVSSPSTPFQNLWSCWIHILQPLSNWKNGLRNHTRRLFFEHDAKIVFCWRQWRKF